MEHTFPKKLGRIFPIILVFILSVELLGCSSTSTITAQPSESPSPTSTLLPTVTLTITPSPTPSPPPCVIPETPVMEPSGDVSIQPGAQLPIRAKAANTQTFTWELGGDGSLSSDTGDVTIYTAPDKSGGLAILSVTASNVCGEASSASLIIHISNVIVSLDKIGIPAGFMTNGNGDPAKYIVMQMVTSGCKTSNCYQFTYKPGNIFAGILWWPKSCGSSGTPSAWAAARNGSCGIKIFEQNEIEPQKLTFWARGEKGGEIVEFMVGAVGIEPSPAESTGPNVLEQVWKQYEIPLTDMKLDNAVALFSWVAADIGNKDNIVFYLDSIQYEGLK